MVDSLEKLWLKVLETSFFTCWDFCTPQFRPVKFPNIWKVFSRFILNFLLKVLNAKPENVEREAEIVAQSGRLGAVTIATNMAGRGTDIILGGNAEFMALLSDPKTVVSEAEVPRTRCVTPTLNP